MAGRVGENAAVTDYVKPPRVLSCEKTDKEVTWSIGEYMYGARHLGVFQFAGQSAGSRGRLRKSAFAGQRKCQRHLGRLSAFAIFLLVLMAGFDLRREQRARSFESTYRLNAGEPKGEASFVTDVFNLDGRTSNVEVTTSADVNNYWIYLNYALINQDTGQAWDFGREVSYYHGYDSDGSWTEGSRKTP